MTQWIVLIAAIFLLGGKSMPVSAQLALTPVANCPSGTSHIALHYFDTGNVLSLGVNPQSGMPALTLTNAAGLYRYDSEQAAFLPYISDDNFGGFFAWSSDGQQVAATLRDGRIGIWNADSGEQLLVFNEKTPEATLAPSVSPDEPRGAPRWYYLDAAWSPDGTDLAAVGTEPLRVWDVQRQQLVFAPGIALKKYGPQFSDFLAWSPDGRYLAMPEGNVLHLWDSRTWEEVRTVTTPLQTIDNLSWSSNGYLAASSAYGASNLIVWNTQTWDRVNTFDDAFRELSSSPSIYAMAWSPDNCWLAVGGGGSHIFILASTSGKIVQTLGNDLPPKDHQILTMRQLVWSLDSTQIFATTDGIISD